MNLGAYQKLNGLAAAGDIINNSDGSYFIEDASGGLAQYDADGNYIDYFPNSASNQTQFSIQSAATDTGGTVANGGIQYPGILNQGQINSLINSVVAKVGGVAGNWAARTIGGNTVIYPRNGGIGTMNIQSLLMPAALILGFFALSKKG